MPEAVLPHPARSGIALTALPPLALYVHIPWCVRKCPYCDFNSHELRAPHPSSLSPGQTALAPQSRPLPQGERGLDADLEARYVAALTADLERVLPLVWGRRVHAVFFGGGTPSLLSVRAMDKILSMVRARLAVSANAEITLEANPGTFEAEKFAQFRRLGINRLSIGVQSLNPRHLQVLGRIHDEREAVRAVEIAHASFDNFNLDLMYALPGQTLEEAECDMQAAIDLRPPHLSAYHLTIEPNTTFHRFPPKVPDDELSATMQERIEQRLAEAGYGHYETSAFAQPGHECQHNLNYWRFGDYVGIGAGAHGKLSLRNRILRQMRWKNPREYMDKALTGESVQTEQEVSSADLPFEFMMNALRLTGGFPMRMFEERTGLPVSAILKALDRAEQLGMIERDHEKVVPTLRGQRFLNDLLQLFLPA